VVPGANGKVDCATVDRHAELIRSAGMVLCQLEIPMETISHTLALCAQAGVPVMLDPAPAATLPDAIWGQVSWFTPNETEAAFYLGENSTPRTAQSTCWPKGLKALY
jgi:ribokinase